ncbi:Ferroportin1 (FPN1) [Fragilaria crotonensis]|nr:Ferroportin1 (FPN1) [Fragilaria crotonensis]
MVNAVETESEDVELIALNPVPSALNASQVHDTDANRSNGKESLTYDTEQKSLTLLMPHDGDVDVDELLLIPPPTSRYWLFATHAVAQFSEVAWKFSMSFFLSALTNHNSLVWVAAFGLSLGTAVTIGMPLMGSWIDSTTLNRLQIVQLIMGIESISIAIASLALMLLLRSQSSDHQGPLWAIFMASVNFFGAIAQLADQSLLVILERDWVVEMSRKDGTWLSTTNVWMRQIDLAAKVVGPVVTGTVALPLLVVLKNADDGTTREDWTRATSVIAIVNIFALILQYVGTSIIYRLVPVLARKRFATHKSIQDEEASTIQPSHGFFSSLKLYISLPASGAGLALSVLYLNALTFGNGIMTAHLLHRAMPMERICLWRGLAALAGLAGTWVFRWSPLTLRWTALWSILYEFVCLLVAALSLAPVTPTFSTGLLIGGVLASRTGLWVFDLCVTQIQQETVPDRVRGLVGGVQQSLNSFFGLGSFAIGLAFPQNFDLYVLAAFGSVGLATAFYICSFRSMEVLRSG